jgi:hypothetical protein
MLSHLLLFLLSLDSTPLVILISNKLINYESNEIWLQSSHMPINTAVACAAWHHVSNHSWDLFAPNLFATWSPKVMPSWLPPPPPPLIRPWNRARTTFVTVLLLTPCLLRPNLYFLFQQPKTNISHNCIRTAVLSCVLLNRKQKHWRWKH